MSNLLDMIKNGSLSLASDVSFFDGDAAFDDGDTNDPTASPTTKREGAARGSAYLALNPEMINPGPDDLMIKAAIDDAEAALWRAHNALREAQQLAWEHQSSVGSPAAYLKSQYDTTRTAKGELPKMPTVLLDTHRQNRGESFQDATGVVIAPNDIYVVASLMEWTYNVDRKPYPLVKLPASQAQWAKDNGVSMLEQKAAPDAFKPPVQIALSLGVNYAAFEAHKNTPGSTNPYITAARTLNPAFVGDKEAAKRLLEKSALDAFIDHMNEPFTQARQNVRWLKEYTATLHYAKWPSARVFGDVEDKPAAPKKPAVKPADTEDTFD
jgi:hypothetical protein